ncbi:MAG: glycosyltransferase family 2 protein [Alphaproteobacteria bacterium]|nr:glycosyltransferase family 2 protein [Alphaproteobacteria bacterium]MDE2109838.1 glycosyltransferase family 2 protein [Alphaproteobacteria bacterium]
MATVSCIIPAYNEAVRIGDVLAVTCAHPLIDEVIAVDDGSTDHTTQIIARFKSARLISQKRNIGKSGAICAGIRASASDFLLFLDADLVGLTRKDVTALLRPVLQGKADASISLRRDALLPWRTIGLDYLSGERVLRRDALMGHLDAIAQLPGFGLETYLNELLIRRQARIEVVWWEGVGHMYKTQKYGIWKGIAGEARMLMNIAETISLAGTAHQIAAMRQLRARGDMARKPASASQAVTSFLRKRYR